MKYKVIVTGIIRCNDEYLVVKRSMDDDFMPGAYEFPGGNVEDNETLNDALKRELREEIGYNLTFAPKIINYSDEINSLKNKHVLELDFLINLDSKIDVNLSGEHSDYKWVTKDSKLLDDFIKSKLLNII